MNTLYLSNTLTGKKEEFKPLKEGSVGIYSCGPTVYWDQHIGNMYAYVQWDVLVRFFRFLGNDVKWVMNITDVGHMTSDEDIGEDKMEKGAKREGVSVWKLAEKYIKQFEDSLELLNITKPDVMPRATKHIKEQIELASKIEKKGFAYKTKMGLVFDTSKFVDYSKFAHLDLKKQKIQKDVETDPGKKVPWDFLLWVTGNTKHAMKWESPWGEGYPGWHLECTAMSIKYLDKKFDIHTGGVEHIPVHHTNEIAQGYAAYGDYTANYWLHNAWLVGRDVEKMSKSLGNYLTVQSLVEKGYDPISFRYLILNSHYKKGLKFSWESLDSANTALKKIRSLIAEMSSNKERKTLSSEKLVKIEKFREKFINSLADDLNVPSALSVLWEMLKSNIPSEDKYDLALVFDEVLGLNISKLPKEIDLPREIVDLQKERDRLRSKGNFKEADFIREKIESMGYVVLDKDNESVIKKQ